MSSVTRIVYKATVNSYLPILFFLGVVVVIFLEISSDILNVQVIIESAFWLSQTSRIGLPVIYGSTCPDSE